MKQPVSSESGLSTSMLRGLRSGAVWLASATPEAVTEFLHGLSEGAFLALPWLFEFWALPHQIAPDGAWRTWVIMGGRGAGKTRAGAEWVRGQVEGAGPADPGRARRVALVGETVDQVREVMIFGESGILACAPPDRRPIWEAGRKRLIWPNGAVAQVISAHDPESLRGPQFDAAWADEYGCPAVDRGTNQPNLFLDARSSESGLPRASVGSRDDLIQMQYFRAVTSYWEAEGVNPVSPIYGGPMLDMARAHAWAWDARPYPAFPLLQEVWSDGPNHDRGHWLNGRATAQPVAAVLAELAERAGLELPDLSGVEGVVRGYALASLSTGRAAVQPLMLACGFDAVESGGRLAFRRRQARVGVLLGEDMLAVEDGTGPALTLRRSGEGEAAGRLRVAYLEAEGDYRRQVAEVQRPDAAGAAALDQEVPLALLPDEARRLGERWLSEARVGRDLASFSLPPSALGSVEVGTVVGLAGRRWRIDRLEHRGVLQAEASRMEPGVYLPGPDGTERAVITAYRPGVPVYPLLMDLPLMTGAEVPHAPHLAVTAEPWPGRVALWQGEGMDGFSLNRVVTGRAMIGVTLNALGAAQTGLWDRGPALRVEFASGALASAAKTAVLNGANLAAIGDGSPEGWELFQFAQAELVAERTWDLSMRLRGQAGTEAGMPAFWPAGSQVVLLDGAVGQIELAESLRGLERTWRIGAAARGFDDPDVVERVEAFAGIGLRPLSVAHLRAQVDGAGTHVSWVRRTRIDGDSWASSEVPLGEEREAYAVRVMREGALLREVEVTAPSWLYPAAWRIGDGPEVTVSVAQLSARFGPGPFRSVTLG